MSSADTLLVVLALVLVFVALGTVGNALLWNLVLAPAFGWPQCTHLQALAGTLILATVTGIFSRGGD